MVWNQASRVSLGSEPSIRPLGKADVARAVKLDRPRGAGRGRGVIGEDSVGGDLVADGAVALDVNAGAVVEGDQVAGGGGASPQSCCPTRIYVHAIQGC